MTASALNNPCDITNRLLLKAVTKGGGKVEKIFTLYNVDMSGVGCCGELKDMI